MNSVLNISAYRFVTLDDPQALRAKLFDKAQALGLLGTILLAREGINLFLAGDGVAVRDFLGTLRADTRLAEPAAGEQQPDLPPGAGGWQLIWPGNRRPGVLQRSDQLCSEGITHRSAPLRCDDL